jgi:hypothetical protein
MAQGWKNHPEDVEYEHKIWKVKKTERRVVRAEKKRRKATILVEYARQSTLDPDSNRWLDVLEVEGDGNVGFDGVHEGRWGGRVGVDGGGVFAFVIGETGEV